MPSPLRTGHPGLSSTTRQSPQRVKRRSRGVTGVTREVTASEPVRGDREAPCPSWPSQPLCSLAVQLAPFMVNLSLPFSPTLFLPPTPRACLRSGPRGISTRWLCGRLLCEMRWNTQPAPSRGCPWVPAVRNIPRAPQRRGEKERRLDGGFGARCPPVVTFRVSAVLPPPRLEDERPWPSLEESGMGLAWRLLTEPPTRWLEAVTRPDPGPGGARWPASTKVPTPGTFPPAGEAELLGKEASFVCGPLSPEVSVLRLPRLRAAGPSQPLASVLCSNKGGPGVELSLNPRGWTKGAEWPRWPSTRLSRSLDLAEVLKRPPTTFFSTGASGLPQCRTGLSSAGVWF